jgi:UDP-N-acetyl-D-mannosaminuronate dehydrogenase
VFVLGVAYKADIADCRESPAVEIVRGLLERGTKVSYHDDLVPRLTVDDTTLLSRPLTRKTLSSADLVLIVTPHSAVDYSLVIRHAKMVFDTRNVTRGLPNAGVRLL